MSRYIVIEGNLTETPALGYGESSGKPYIKLNVAVNDRVKAEDGSWTDGPATFYRVTAFGSRAENAAASFTKGDTVIAAGNLTVAGFTRADGSECGLFSAPRLQLLDVLPTARTDRGAQATKRLGCCHQVQSRPPSSAPLSLAAGLRVVLVSMGRDYRSPAPSAALIGKVLGQQVRPAQTLPGDPWTVVAHRDTAHVLWPAVQAVMRAPPHDPPVAISEPKGDVGVVTEQGAQHVQVGGKLIGVLPLELCEVASNGGPQPARSRLWW